MFQIVRKKLLKEKKNPIHFMLKIACKRKERKKGRDGGREGRKEGGRKERIETLHCSTGAR